MSRTFAEFDLPVGGYRPPPSAVAAPTASRAKASRWLGLDLFRFAAVLLMVQGHVFSTLLDSATKAQGWYPHHSFLHGYTAPMFLFGAGLAFGYTTFRRWDQHTAGGPAALKRYKRYGWLLVLGYGLHLPTLSITRLLAIDDPDRVARLLQVDVLQHIGVSLAICQLLVFVIKRQRIFVAVVGALAAIAIFAAPWIWNIDLSDTSIPVGVAGYLNASTGSMFPLVPWAGFTYLGIVVAYVVGVSGEARSISDRVAWPFLVLSLLFMIAPVAVDRFGPFPWPAHNFWKTNPLFFFWRLGNIMFVLAGLCFAERWIKNAGWLDPEPKNRLASLAQKVLPWVMIVGAESLVIYVAHLLLLHGSVVAPGIKHSGWISAGAHGLLVASLVAGGFVLAMVLLGKVWFELRKSKARFRAVQWALIGAVVVAALMGR